MIPTDRLIKLLKKVYLFTGILLITLPNMSLAQEQSDADDINKAKSVFLQLDSEQNYQESLTYADMNVMPMGLKQTVNNVQVTIAVSDMRWYPTHSELTVFARFVLPEQENTLFFGAEGIKLSHTGDIVGDASLVLLGDYTIPINGNTASLTLKGSFDKLIGRSGEKNPELTFITIGCEGFKELGIAAEVAFPESLLKKVNEKGEAVAGKVTGSFKTIVTGWNDIIASINFPSFEIVGLKGFIFNIENAVFDFSDFRNEPSIVYPQNYVARYLIPGNEKLWRGVYVKQLEVVLPKQFSNRTHKSRVSIAAQHMILDNNGVSGLFSGENVLPLKEGSASGWRFSVDKFSLGLEANVLNHAGFNGKIGLPVGEKSALDYNAYITADNEYNLMILAQDSIQFDVFKAEAEILPNSYVQMVVKDDQFKPEAMLHGSLNLSPTLGDKKLAEFKGIEFRSLHLKTESPRFTAEYFGYKGELKLMNFPISVDRIGLRVQEKEVALGLDVKLTLSDAMFTGSTRLEIIAKFHEQSASEGGSATQQWKYDKVAIQNIKVDASIASTFSLKGELAILNDDPIYGNGFGGKLELNFNSGLKGVKVSARGIFGKTEFRYWFVDGKVEFGTGIPVAGPLSITGFGGGVSYRMKRKGFDQLASETGSVFIPDENYGVGVKAAVLFNVANDAAINGEASFEIAFSRSGGLNSLGFYGYAKFLGKIPGADKIESFVGDKMNKIAELEDKFVGDNPALAKTLENLKQYEPNKAAEAIFEPSESPGQAGFAAAVGIQFNFVEKSFHATFDLYVNAIGGIIKGTASGNRAGWAVMHIDPHEWYLHMGTPTDRLGLSMNIGNILKVKTGSYLMLGDRIPGSPPPPQQVADILGIEMEELDYMRDLNALGDGRGFAFGASLEVSTGDITFLMLYANFQAGLGFDVMLKDYGEAQCKGRSGTIGIDGWYANGQAYAYLQGELGIKVNLWFIKGKFPIIQGAAAVLLQAQLPDPIYFRGYIAARFSILGGLISGRCRFKFTLGEQCELVIPGGSPLDFLMISDFVPTDRSEDVDVFAAPQATFTMRLEHPFDIPTDEGIEQYRVHLNEFTLEAEDKALDGKLIWTSEKDAISFYSHEVLPPHKTIKALIKVGFEQWINGKWVTVYTGGQLAQEIKEVTFTTGDAPDNIPIHNVEYAYPVVDQKYYLKDETKQSFIQLKRGQGYLFSNDYQHEIHIVKQDGSMNRLDFNYNTATNTLEYTMPSLGNSQVYSANVVTLSKEGTNHANSELTNVSVEKIVEEENEINISTARASEIIRSDIGKNLLSYGFHTSRFGTFAQKVNSIQKEQAEMVRISSGVVSLHYRLRDTEPFELTDLRGTEFTAYKPLVSATALLRDAYYQQDIFPIVYQNYPVAGITLDRDPEPLGIPPVKAVPVSTAYLTEIESNNYLGLAKSRMPFYYNLPQIYKQDFQDLQNKIVNRFLETPERGRYEHIINGFYKFIRHGQYPVKLQYTLPNGVKGSSAEFEFYSFIEY